MVDGILRLGAGDEGGFAVAERDALGGFVDVAHRAFAADLAVEGARGRDAEALGKLRGQVFVAPAYEGDDVEAVDLPQEPARVVIGAARGLGHQRQRFERCRDILRAVGDFADAGDDGDAVGGKCSHAG